MKRLQYIGTFDIPVLRYQLLARFPEWRYEEYPIFIDYFGLEYDEISMILMLDVPDISDENAIQEVLDAHDPKAQAYSIISWQEVIGTRNAFLSIPDWSTWTAQEASDFINQDILSGMTKMEIEDWVEINVTTLATAKTALKLIGGELVDLRNICMRIAQSIVYLRDVAVRRRV